MIGAYRDKDENFPLTGMIHEVRIYDRALDAAEIEAQFRLKSDRFPPPAAADEEPPTFDVAVGPWLQFTGPDSATVRWHTAEPSPTIFEYRLDDQIERIAKNSRTTVHEVQLSGLRRKRLYHYAIQFLHHGQTERTPEYECDTFFNYSVASGMGHNTRPDGDRQGHAEFSSAATAILKLSGQTRGLCLDWNAGSCRLAENLVRQSDLRVLCVCREPAAATAARKRLQAAGLYGSRIVVRHAPNLQEEGLTPYWANLVVSQRTLIDGQPPASGDRLRNHLTPTGVAILGVLSASDDGRSDARSALHAWADKDPSAGDIVRDSAGEWVALKGQPFEGAGEWPYIYGGADNAAYGGESLAGARPRATCRSSGSEDPARGTRPIAAAQTPPLSFGGRLFLEGLHRIVALDIYNGTVQWSLEIPHFERFNIPRDCANWCGANDSLFAAVRDRCWRVDAATGEVLQRYTIPEQSAGDGEFDWGYVAVASHPHHEDLVIGSAVRRGTSFTDFWGGQGWYDAAEGPETFKVCSDSLFAHDEASGQLRWRYSDGLVINSTITMNNGRLFFVEGRDPQLKSTDARRIGSEQLWKRAVPGRARRHDGCQIVGRAS